MTTTEAVLVYSAGAAAAAGFGAFPFAFLDRLPAAVIGWANALAAGLMLGAAHLLALRGLDLSPFGGSGGAVAGAALVWIAHAISGGAAVALPTTREGALIRASLHSAGEGVAIGAAMLVSEGLGAFVAAGIAAHNVPEAMALCSTLRRTGVTFRESALLAILANSTQVLLSVAAVLFVGFAPASLGAVLGLAAGALVYLVLVDLLPDSYALAGKKPIALATCVALGAIVLFGGGGGPVPR